MSSTATQPPRSPAQDRFSDLRGGIRLCYRTYGDDGRRAVLLVAGLGLQLTCWPADFIDALTSAGYRVITPDNRDVGRSTRLTTRPPGTLGQLLGHAPADNYSLEDMADDNAELLDLLGSGRTHLVGMSMGGMIVQAMAARHPGCTASLTSIASTTGHRRVGQPAWSTLWRIATMPRPRSLHEAVRNHALLMRHIGDATSPGIEREWRDQAGQAWERSGQRSGARGIARQIGAIHQSGDRTAQLRHITAPTLVLHGEIDRMVSPMGGRATADAIPGARFVIVPGLRHQIDVAGSPKLAACLLEHLKMSDARDKTA